MSPNVAPRWIGMLALASALAMGCTQPVLIGDGGADAPSIDAPRDVAAADTPGADAPAADAPGADVPSADAPGADDAPTCGRCDDGFECTVDACGASGMCEHIPDDTRCTAAAGGRCDPDAGCQYESCTAATCVALDLCETATCTSPTTCTRMPVACADDANPCTAEVCMPDVGCTNLPVLEGMTCGPGNDALCRESVCRAGVCAARSYCDVGEACCGDGICGPPATC